ncbi:hypothetical protein PIIN_05535 [Serendipita indica DSM 11827]|uniref:Uncharacterized protein n=1 Tax=Serendipita indica (strain DSM 11827) TaxID=1109443 RepID=G4TJV6_SERID|nr:hypothetical protein PIIN_05535 [Serendipita indica DSM 11827]
MASASTTNADESEIFWTTNPPPIPPALRLLATHAQWAIDASQKSRLFPLQLLHLALASQHCVYHLASELDGEGSDSGSDTDIALDQVETLSGILDDLDDIIETTNNRHAI